HVAEISNDDSIATIIQLQEWIVESSDWNYGDKVRSEMSLRAALLSELSSNGYVDVETNLLYSLVEAVTLINPMLTADLQVSFVQTIEYSMHIDEIDANTLFSEAQELETMEKTLGQSVISLAERLRERAFEIEEERQADPYSSDPEQHRYTPEPTEEFDIDELFAGLLDR
ncbi:MAG: hypothetical protein HKP13_10670, partial [Gammaproteobacteria bacterium]|nr:hypothetical protein [Gammaproteobacteria bacterium]